jgi:uncharacterized membrane protein
MIEDEKYRRAKKRVMAMKGFYIHLFFYVTVNMVLFLINMVTSSKHLWFFWPLLGWGIGILAHAFSVWGLVGWFGREWEERKIKELMEKDKG